MRQVIDRARSLLTGGSTVDALWRSPVAVPIVCEAVEARKVLVHTKIRKLT